MYYNPSDIKSKYDLAPIFESIFKEQFGGDYTIEASYETSNGPYKHTWDYAISKDGKLDTVADIDMTYTHHYDEYEYDGVNGVKPSDDIDRIKSIPEGVKYAFINERRFDESVNILKSVLGILYDKFIDGMIEAMRVVPFPFPTYTDKELMISWGNILRVSPFSYKAQHGFHIIHHFHPSLWIHGDGSPYDKYSNIDTLTNMVNDKSIVYSIDRNSIVLGFDINGEIPHLVSPALIKLAIMKYLPEEKAIFDPCSGYSCTMLASAAIGREFHGYDADMSHVNESNKMIKWLDEHSIHKPISIELGRAPKGEYPAMLTVIDDELLIKQYMEMYDCPIYVFIRNYPNIPNSDLVCVQKKN